MATLARNRFPSGLGWFVLLALLLLAWCHGITSCGTRQKAVTRHELDSLWNRQALKIAREQARVWYWLEDMRLEQLRSWSGEIVDYDTAGRTRRRATFSGSEEGRAEGSRAAGSADTLSERVATGQDQGNISREDEEIRKKSNTTLISNIPWYAWVLGAIVALVGIYLFINRFGKIL